MQLDKLTVGEVREICALFGGGKSQTHPYVIGEKYFIRTVTHHFTGQLVAVHQQELVITDAAWIADDGRFTQAIAKGEFNEVEPYPDNEMVVIGRSSIIDAVRFTPDLPRSQK